MTHNVAGFNITSISSISSSSSSSSASSPPSFILIPSPSILSLVNEGDAVNEIKQLEYIIDIIIKNNRNGINLEGSFSQPTDLQQFVSYALNRRFGWSENKTNTLQEHKQSLNSLLDTFTHLLCNQSFTSLLCDLLLSSASSSSLFSSSSFSSFSSPSSSRVTVSHVVRDQTYKLLFDWIKCQYTMNDVIIIQFDKDDSGLESDGYGDLNANGSSKSVDLPSVIRVILSGLTDVWSAIRNSCANRMLSLLEMFDIYGLETLFQRLSTICGDTSASWQAQEGAALGIVSIIKSFRLEPIKVFAPDQSQSTLLLQLGRNRYDGLPAWLHDQARNLLFPLLSNPQLSIREIAKKGLVAFHARSPHSDILVTRDSLVRSLLALPPSPIPLPDPAQLPSTHPIMDPYAAEGLLSVCNTILRADAEGLFSYDDWAHQLHAYILYLAHPASTVRIEASSIFKHIVARYTDSPFVIQMVLQCLGADWHFPFRSALLPPQTESLPYLPLSPSNEPSDSNVVPSPPSWEWKEGRLLAYELVFNFLLANHIHYTQPHSHKLRRVSKSKLSLSLSTPTTPNTSAPTTPSTPNRPYNSQREGLARSVSLERVDTIPSTSGSQQRTPNSVRRNSCSGQDDRPLRLSSHALSLIEQLAEGSSVMPASLPFSDPLPIAIILQHISAQVAESFGFPRWEINRMAEQVLKPLVDTLYLLGTSVNATIPTSLPTPSSSTPSLSEPTQDNSISDIPMLCLLWYHPFVEIYHSPPRDAPKQPTDRPNQKIRPPFLPHTRRDILLGQNRVRSFSNPQLRLAIPTPPISPSIQFMACKSLRHALVIVANRQYSVRARADDSNSSFPNAPPHLPHSPNTSHRPHSPNARPHSPNAQPSCQSPNSNSSPSSTLPLPASPKDRRLSLQPTIAQHIVGNLEPIQKRIVSLITGILENSNNTTAANDDRLIVAACELLVIISVGDWTPMSDIASNSQIIGHVFQWMARLSHSRKSKIEGQLLSALHPHLIKLIQRIPISNTTNSTPPTKSDTALTLACYLVPLIPSHADPVLQASLLDAITAALDKLPLGLGPNNTFFDMDNLRLLCTLCTKWLVKLLGKPLEGSVLRSALGVLYRVVRVVIAYSVSSEAILSHIFKAIASRLAPFIPHSPVSELQPLETLSLHSNEIIHSWDTRDMDSDFDDGETEDDDEDDDWDDEDDTTGGEVVVGECTSFLQKIKVAEGAVSKILLVLPTHERTVLSWALSKNGP